MKRYKLPLSYELDLTCGEDVHRRIIESHVYRYFAANAAYTAMEIEHMEYVCNQYLMKKFNKMKITLAQRHGFLSESEKPLLFWHVCHICIDCIKLHRVHRKMVSMAL